MIIAHHAGKNSTQRGRTDNNDITDLIMQLNNRNTVVAIRKKAEAAGTEFAKPKAKAVKAG